MAERFHPTVRIIVWSAVAIIICSTAVSWLLLQKELNDLEQRETVDLMFIPRITVTSPPLSQYTLSGAFAKSTRALKSDILKRENPWFSGCHSRWQIWPNYIRGEWGAYHFSGRQELLLTNGRVYAIRESSATCEGDRVPDTTQYNWVYKDGSHHPELHVDYVNMGKPSETFNP